MLYGFFAMVACFLLVFPFWGLQLSGYDLKVLPGRGLGAVALVLGAGLMLRVFRAISPARFHNPIPLQRLSKAVTAFYSTPHLRWVPAFVFMTLPFLSDKYWLSVMILCMIYVLLGLGLNIVVGLAGLLDLGFVGFYAIGAYIYAIGAESFGLGFWGALPLAALCAGLFGAILGFPVLRMHGDYLAIVTLGFGEIIRLVLNNWLEVTGGPNGLNAPGPTLFGIEFGRRAKQGGMTIHELTGLEYAPEHEYMFLYFLLFFACLLLMRFLSRVKQMPLGRAWEALREDEIACRSLGINHVSTKLSAFSIGAMWGGVAGVMFAAFQGFINPSSFSFFESAIILAIVVLGGMGSVGGVVIAAVVVTGLPEILREFSQYRILIFGLLMVGMMLFRPQGIALSRRKKYSLEAS
jgi:branched-chain amino acid transport system permease protein